MHTAQQIISRLKLRGDADFVRNELRKYDDWKHDAIMNRYVEQWRSGMDSGQVEQKKQNCGRRRANIWLRENKH